MVTAKSNDSLKSQCDFLPLDLIEWDDIYSIGNQTIDLEHKNLFESINNYIIETRGGHGLEVLDKTLSAMIAYADSHFDREEKLMLRYGYKKYNKHKHEHDQFRHDIAKYKMIIAGGDDISLEVAFYLPAWIKHHVLNVDMNMGLFLREHAHIVQL